MNQRTQEFINFFDVAVSYLRNSPYTIVMQSQNNYTLITFYKATHLQASTNTGESLIFKGTKKEAIIFLQGLISGFSTFQSITYVTP